MLYKIPKKVEYKGVVYEVDASVGTIIHIMQWLRDDTLDEIDRANVVVANIFGVHAPTEQPLIEEAMDIIRLGRSENQHKQQEQDMDFIYDYDTIRMDIIREYGVDIAKEEVTWDWFVSAIENLGKDSILNTKRMYRGVKLTDYKDPKQRKDIKKIKEAIALPKEILQESEEQKSNKERMNHIMKQFGKKGG